ncbi:hypothetical protein HanIR_Chr01g0031511 [Helianthus annuus]|nr:hypothetical protein HanIR_Chr01g0031511 [Helianthus annuus]
MWTCFVISCNFHHQLLLWFRVLQFFRISSHHLFPSILVPSLNPGNGSFSSFPSPTQGGTSNKAIGITRLKDGPDHHRFIPVDIA